MVYTDINAANTEIDRLKGELVKVKLKDNDRQKQFAAVIGVLAEGLEKAHKSAPVAVSADLINQVKSMQMVGYHETMDNIQVADMPLVAAQTEAPTETSEPNSTVVVTPTIEDSTAKTEAPVETIETTTAPATETKKKS